MRDWCCREGAEEKQEASRDSYKGKQFLPSCAKSGRTPDTYFGLDKEKKHLYIAEVCMNAAEKPSIAFCIIEILALTCFIQLSISRFVSCMSPWRSSKTRYLCRASPLLTVRSSRVELEATFLLQLFSTLISLDRSTSCADRLTFGIFAVSDVPISMPETQPEKPGKGFLTSDYNRRGEFTNTIRTEQYRAQLKVENTSFSCCTSARGMEECSLAMSWKTEWLLSKILSQGVLHFSACSKRRRLQRRDLHMSRHLVP